MAYSEAQEFGSAKPLPISDKQAKLVMATYLILGLLLPIVIPTAQIIHSAATADHVQPSR